MNNTPIRRLVCITLALIMSALQTDRLQAQQPLTLGSWLEFFYFDGINPVDGAGFTVLSPTNQLRVRVTDAGISGDRFQLFSGATLLFTTAVVSNGVDTGLFAGDQAWIDPSLSHGEIILGPGNYTFTVQVSATGSGFVDGSGFIRADIVPNNNVVPEPASILLTASGLLVLAFASRRRRSC